MTVNLTDQAPQRAEVVVEGRFVAEIVRNGQSLRMYAPSYFEKVDFGSLNKSEARAVGIALIEMAATLPDETRIA